MSVKKTFGGFIKNLHPLHRVLISLGLSTIAFFILQIIELNALVMCILIWDVFALSYCTTSWLVFFTRTAPQIMHHAKEEDGSRLFVYFIILLSSFASLLTVLLLIISDKATQTTPLLYVPASIVGILLSWMIVHITFGFHYAHLYYDDDGKGKKNEITGGLDFPDDIKPDYIDFAYFSFVIGMTFQVSDVRITSAVIRRLVLFHSLLSFILNTFVVALTINLIASLKNG